MVARIKGNKEAWLETGANRVHVESEGPVVKEMAFVAYSVRDVPKAIEFYRDVIGLKPGDMVSEYWAEFDLGNTTFGIGNGESIGIIPGKSFSATFEVDDLVSTRDGECAAGHEIVLHVDDEQHFIRAFHPILRFTSPLHVALSA